MSLQRIILISGTAHISGYIERDGYTTEKPSVSNQDVNVLLGGTMMGGIIVMVVLICYCCHRKQQKRHSHLPRYWRDPGLAMEVYTVQGSQIFEMHQEFQRPTHQGSPPSYESVMLPECDDNKSKSDLQNEQMEQRNFDIGLPTYEDAIEMARQNGKNV